jgi:hypothetical protein
MVMVMAMMMGDESAMETMMKLTAIIILLCCSYFGGLI